MPKSYKPNQATILYLNSSYNCEKSSSISLAISSGGSGYTSAPTITITPTDTGYGASATAVLTSGTITSITMNNNGINYNKLPKITLSGDAIFGTITGYTSLVAGSGYKSPPTITASGGGGSNFSATAVLGTKSLDSANPITIVAGGSGYTAGQALIFTGVGGSGVYICPYINLYCY